MWASGVGESGDANGDLKVSIEGAVLVLQITVNTAQPNPELRANTDVNTDINIDVIDAFLILKKIVGLP